MRVGYVMSRFPKLSETFILREMLQLERSGIEIDVFALVEEKHQLVHDEVSQLQADRHFPSLISPRLWGAHLYWLANHPVRYLNMWARTIFGNWSSPRFLLRAIVVALAAASFARIVRQRNIQHLHAHYATHPALAAYLMSLLTKTTYSVTTHAHDIYVNYTMLSEKLERASFVATISEFNRRLLAELAPASAAKLRVIRCGVNPAEFRDVKPAEAGPDGLLPLRILSVGSLEPYKGQINLVRACQILRDRAIPFECMIAGAGPERRKLRAHIYRHNLEDIVRLIGPVDQRSVRRLLRWSTVFVLPSVITPNGKMEGIPVALMEAMATGAIAISTRISGIPELIISGETGFLVEPGDPGEIADVLSAIRNSLEELRTIRRRARHRISSEYNLQRNVEQLEREIRRAVAESPLRIAQIVDNLEIGGAQQLLKTFVENRREPGTAITIVNLSNEPAQPLQAELERLGVSVVNLGGATLKSLPRFLRLIALLWRERIEVTQTHLRYANILGVFASRLIGVPAIATLHSAGADRAHYHPLRQLLETTSLRYFASRVVAVGPAVERAHAKRLAGRPIDVFPNAVTPGVEISPDERSRLRQELAGDATRPILIAVGRLVPVKGFADLIAAMDEIVQQHPRAVLLIAGNGVLRDSLSEKIRDRGLEASIQLLGARSDVRQLLAASDIFVNASHLEGLPVALLEAMAAGLPSVATSVGDIPSVLSELTGILVPPEDPASLAQAVATLLDNPVLAKRLGAAAQRQIAQHHDATRWAGCLVDFARGLRDGGNDVRRTIP